MYVGAPLYPQLLSYMGGVALSGCSLVIFCVTLRNLFLIFPLSLLLFVGRANKSTDTEKEEVSSHEQDHRPG